MKNLLSNSIKNEFQHSNLYCDSFDIQFPFSAGYVQIETSQSSKNYYIKLDSNGAESGHSKSIIEPFDNQLKPN